MSEIINYCLSVQQPWAALIITGRKKVEHRTWKPPQKIIGKRIFIHASKKVDTSCHYMTGRAAGKATLRRLSEIKGAIIGSVVIAGYLDHFTISGDLIRSPVDWTLKDAQILETPVYCKGRLGIWKVEDMLDADELLQFDFAHL